MPSLSLNIGLNNGRKLPFGGLDADAAAYIAAVEAADGQALEAPVKTAITTFIVNVKAQGGWDAIKSACILSGARTFAGALTPLKGTAPTNVRLSSDDYSRRFGISAGSTFFLTPYIDTNRANNSDPQNDKHLGIYLTNPIGILGDFIAGSGVSSGDSLISVNAGDSDFIRLKTNSSANTNLPWYLGSGFTGFSRYSSTLFAGFSNSGIQNTNYSSLSVTPTSSNITLLGRASGSATSSERISFYSIGTTIYDAINGAKAFNAINDNLTILMTAFSTI